MCEEKQSAELLRLDGGYWEGGTLAVEKGVMGLSKDEEEMEEMEWEQEVLSTLRSLSSVQTQEG
jgi:nuclear pore complex protein Nup107